MNNDELTTQEREALDAWQVPGPPPDLARQVLQRARMPGAGVRAGRHLRWVAALAAALALALGAALLLWPTTVDPGRLAAAERTTVQLGRRGVLVAEAGAELRWQQQGATLRLRQRRGNVFYRVARDHGPFVVRTPAGSVRVLGTCFRLEVFEMKAGRAGATGAALGAAAASLVLVTVYEGKVLTATPRGEQTVEAGRMARLQPGRAPELLAEAGEPRRDDRTRQGPGQGEVSDSTVRGLVTQNQKLLAEKQQLQAQLQVVQSQLAESSGKASSGKILGLSQEELKQLAKRCELRWDLPPLRSTPPGVDSRAVKKLGLTDAERDAVKKVLADYHRRMTRELRKLYVEVTGDAKNAESLSPDAMISEIQDKSPSGELRHVFQRLARERAGLQTPPADLSQTSATERFYRLLTSAGDQVEQAMGAEIGPDLARRYREIRNGFGSRSRSSHGCPR